MAKNVEGVGSKGCEGGWGKGVKEDGVRVWRMIGEKDVEGVEEKGVEGDGDKGC